MLDTVRRWIGTPAPAPKAETGPGVYAMSTYPQLSSIANHPAKMMAEAQVLFQRNPWVKRAEQTIYGRYVKAAWHLEDSAGNTIDPKASGPSQVVLDLLTNPNPDQSRRALWSLTMRHQGLCGNAFWYLDQRVVGGGPPTQLLYINPVRMTPVQTEAGKLQGWVMDHPQNPVSQGKNLRTPVPFTLDELRHFKLDEPDWDHYGIGIAEAAYDQVLLEEQATSHATAVLSSGGRIAGLISPKPNVTMNDEQWAGLVRDWRNIASDPNAAKRLLIVKGPVDFTNTAANFSELEMGELLNLSRDNVFAAWGIPLSQGPGIATSKGLNSGETQKFEEAALWQGPIDLRSGPFEEQVQSVIDMFGLGLRLVVESPAFDDQAPLFANAEKATKQPLTNNERRALLGFDPLEDDELGKAVYVESVMTRIDGEIIGTPLNPFNPFNPSEEDATPADSGLGEATTSVKAARNLAQQWTPHVQQALQAFLAEQATAIAGRVKNNHAHIVSRPSDTDSWWSGRKWDTALVALLTPFLEELGVKVSRQVARPLGKADFLDRVLALIRRTAGLRIGGINQTTRDSVARLIAEGVEAGLSPADLAQTIRDGATFNEARAELIARTETGTVYNQAAIETYRSHEVAEVQVIDGDKDDICASANGSTWTLEEAESNPLGHPNCTRDFIPVLAAKASEESVTPEDLASIQRTIIEALKATGPAPYMAPASPVSIHLPSRLDFDNMPPPQINLPAPDIHVNVPEQKAPNIHVNVPQQEPPIVNVSTPEVKAATVQDVRVLGMPERLHHVQRDDKGEVQGSIEIDGRDS